jgi:hypothetical protein
MGAIYDPACVRDPARASGPGCRDNSTYLRDSASAPLEGWAPSTTWRVSVTRQGFRARTPHYSARLRDYASDPARGLGTIYHSKSLIDPNQDFRVRELS